MSVPSQTPTQLAVETAGPFIVFSSSGQYQILTSDPNGTLSGPSYALGFTPLGSYATYEQALQALMQMTGYPYIVLATGPAG